MRKLITRIIAATTAVALATSCTTTYDRYGHPQQSVAPEDAALGVAAALLIGVALASDRHDGHRRHKRSHYGHYNDHHYRHSGPRRRGCR